MNTKNKWTVKELSKHLSNFVLSADAIEYFINELMEQKKKESGTSVEPEANKYAKETFPFLHDQEIFVRGAIFGASLPVTGESEAIEKAIIEELQSILSSGVHPEYLPEKINDRIAELKGDKSYT